MRYLATSWMRWRRRSESSATVFDTETSNLAEGSNVDLLEARFDKTAARVHVIVRELLLHLSDAQAIGDHFRDRASPDTRGSFLQSYHIDHVGNGLECFSSIQSSIDFSSIRSYFGFVLLSVYQ